VIGLSASGLRKLGLNEEALGTFPTAFQHGMAAPWRAQALGDIGANAPRCWKWGGPENSADAIVCVYALSQDILAQRLREQKEHVRTRRINIVREIALDEILPRGHPAREPFGFTDGVSQPIVRGAQREVVAGNEIHVVAPGEMILGYEDNSGHFPSSPVAADYDLGRNGTYLVVRQLEQDSRAFERFLNEQAQHLLSNNDPRVPPRIDPSELREWIAAKMVGRWKDGTSLVRHPHQPGSATRPGMRPDNHFLFGTEDPDGLRCPFGAHIRRVNPRESAGAGSAQHLEISNRHRIFRVGRKYSAQDDLKNPGLLFMCVNANIERQFEFVQQTYMLGSTYRGLEDEVDPFTSGPESSNVLTIPTERGPLRLKGLPSFVTVRGGGYFFMPSRDAVRFLIDLR